MLTNGAIGPVSSRSCTFGAKLNWNVHIHVIITCGGLSRGKDRWVVSNYIPQEVIRPMYRCAFLQEMKTLFRAGLLRPPPSCRAIRDYSTFNSWLTQFYKKEWCVYLGRTLEVWGRRRELRARRLAVEFQLGAIPMN